MNDLNSHAHTIEAAVSESDDVQRERRAIVALVNQQIDSNRQDRTVVRALDFLKDCIEQRGR